MTPVPKGQRLSSREGRGWPTPARSLVAAAVLALALMMASVVTTPTPADASGHRRSPSIYQCDFYRPTLRQWVGGQSQCVAALQGFLEDVYDHTDLVDGIFGPRTAWAVIQFQDDLIPPADGIVGPVTWQAIFDYCHYISGTPNLCHRTYSY